MGFVKNIYSRMLLMPGVPICFRFAQRNCATVFMLHRFMDKDRGIEGIDPAIVRRGLDYLRRNNYEFISLTELFSRLAGNRKELNGAVAFTIDDGYIDHAKIAGPLFAEFDCPVTTFLTTGFLDGTMWMWWDNIEYIFTTTRRRSVTVRLSDEQMNFAWGSRPELDHVINDFVERCKVLSDEEKHNGIAFLAENAEVDLPVKPPPKYSPMTWDDVRTCEGKGMTFGPHTVTHPVLRQTTPEQVAWEIGESWRRLRTETSRPVPVFCYPNGQWGDFSFREIEILRKEGLWGAVVGEPGFADPASFKRDRDEPFKVKRLPFPESLSDLIQYSCGIERCKQIVRGMA